MRPSDYVARRYLIGVRHESFGIEGQRWHVGTEREAIEAARYLAAQGGHGWLPYVFSEDGFAVSLRPEDRQ